MKLAFVSAGSAALFLTVAIACRSSSEPPAPFTELNSQSATTPSATLDAPSTTVGVSKLQPFLPAELCGKCHSQSASATALTSATGDDVSPHGTWQATAMANAFRDPYWRAQMSHEVERAPERKIEIESLCLNCHAPIASHTARLTEAPAPSIESTVGDALANEGVSCTVCHRATSAGLGTPDSFEGRLAIQGDARIYGPFADPAPGPMKAHTGFTPTFGAHISSSALCGSCHTLTTQPSTGAKPFVEQAVYLEWRNSVFSDENGRSSESRTCQECHMPDAGAMRIARNPAGFDFNIQVRDPVRAHTFVGGNAFLIDLLRTNAAELGVIATEGALKRVAAATRAQLAHETARLTISNAMRKQARISFDVKVENLAGHKFPSGYPARRAWLDVEVRAGREVLFESGAVDERGALVGVADELALPHFDRIERADQVQVYEMIAADGSGRTTTSLISMASRLKDNRLLPRGWKSDGPHVADTHPVGVEGDDDFTAGSDVVTYDVEVKETDQPLLVIARLTYQSIPPAWASSLKDSKTPESVRFLTMYGRAKNEGEAVALTTVNVPR
ncbi:MAG: multiheme c-type cytochrome [Planctomycetota bacterium]|nr:multiheme c-type cytochrome [Planctomycetota bacterium]